MEKLEPLQCCYSGCLETGDELNGWWGDFIYCTKHNEEVLKGYIKYLSSHSDDLDDDLFE